MAKGLPDRVTPVALKLLNIKNANSMTGKAEAAGVEFAHPILGTMSAMNGAEGVQALRNAEAE